MLPMDLPKTTRFPLAFGWNRYSLLILLYALFPHLEVSANSRSLRIRRQIGIPWKVGYRAPGCAARDIKGVLPAVIMGRHGRGRPFLSVFCGRPSLVFGTGSTVRKPPRAVFRFQFSNNELCLHQWQRKPDRAPST